MAVAGNWKIQWFARAEDTANAGTHWSRGAVDMIRVAGISSGRRCRPRSATHDGDGALKLPLRGRSHLFNRGHTCTAAAAGECICTDACRLKLALNRYGHIAGRCGHRAVETPPASRLCRGDRRHSLSSTYCGSARRTAGAIKLRSEWTRGKQCGVGLSQEEGAKAYYRRNWDYSRKCGERITCGRSHYFSNRFVVDGDVLGNGIGAASVRSRHWQYGAWSNEGPGSVRLKERSTAMENHMEKEDGFASRSWKVEALQRSGEGTFQEESEVKKPVILLPISSEEDFEAALAEGQRSKRIVIIEWMAQWCRKCIYLKPKLERLALEYPKYKFYEVDVNNVPGSLVKRSGITKMPTIQVWKDGEKKAEVSGGSEAWVVIDKLKDLIRKG